MARGIDLQLFAANGTTPLANTTFRMVWLDTDAVLVSSRLSANYSMSVTTDATGWLHLDLSSISGLPLGGTGFIALYAPNGQNSLVFSGQVTITTVTGGVDPYNFAEVLAAARNPDWPAAPVITNGVEKFTGLVSVVPDSAYSAAVEITVIATGGAGTFSINWGDGTTETPASGFVSHTYSYASVPGVIVGTSKSAPVTFTDVGDLVNYTAHPYMNGQLINFSSIVSTTGISVNTEYYVVNRTASSFQVASTIGGSPIALTTDGSGAVFIPQHKVAVVTVTPTGGSTITGLYFTGITPWLEHAVNFAALNSLSYGISGNKSLQIFRIGQHAVASWNGVLSNNNAIEFADIDASGANNLSSLFANGSLQALKGFNLKNTSSVTTFANMFSACRALRMVPYFDTSAATDCTNMFQQCYQLRSVPLYNLASATNLSGMFDTCYSLEQVPTFNTSNCTDFSFMFYTCRSLVTAPPIDTSKATTFNWMFVSCMALKNVPLYNSSLVTNFSNMFASCLSLENPPALDTRNGLDFSSMYSNCWQLKTLPTIEMRGNEISVNSMFSGCNSLLKATITNVGLTGGAATSMFSGCSSMVSLRMYGMKDSFDITNAKLTAAALNDLYTSLGTANSGATITVSSNPGVSGDDTSIAIAKGWTVVG